LSLRLTYEGWQHEKISIKYMAFHIISISTLRINVSNSVQIFFKLYLTLTIVCNFTERYPAASTDWLANPSVYPTDVSQVLPWRYYMFGLDEMIDEKIKHLQDPKMENINLLEAKITALEEQKEAVNKRLTGTVPMTDQDIGFFEIEF
jgi:hypothetical protein